MPPYEPVESYELDTGESSYGTIIMVADTDIASPLTYHAIAGVGDIDGPNESVGVNETLTHSTGRPYKNKRPGLIDPGEFSFPVNYDPANPSHSRTSTYGLAYIFKERIVADWLVIYPDDANTTLRFRGFISELGTSSPVEGVGVRTTTITIDGQPEEIPFPF